MCYLYFTRERETGGNWTRTSLEIIKRDLNRHYPCRGVKQAIIMLKSGRIIRTTHYEYIARVDPPPIINRELREVTPRCFTSWSNYWAEIVDICIKLHRKRPSEINADFDYHTAFMDGYNPYAAVYQAIFDALPEEEPAIKEAASVWSRLAAGIFGRFHF